MKKLIIAAAAVAFTATGALAGILDVQDPYADTRPQYNETTQARFDHNVKASAHAMKVESPRDGFVTSPRITDQGSF